MIGCLILGTFAAVAAAKVVRYRMAWHGHGRWHGHLARHLHRRWGGGHFYGGGFGGGGGGGCGGGGGGLGAYGDGAETGEAGEGPFEARWGGGGFGGHEHGHGFGHGRHGRGRDFVLSAVLDHLRVTPTQERAVRAATDEFRDEVKRAAGGEGKKTRLDLAAAMRKPAVDEVLLGELFARQDAALEGSRKAFVGLMSKIHDALDEEQRGRLAELMEKGPRFWRRGFDW